MESIQKQSTGKGSSNSEIGAKEIEALEISVGENKGSSHNELRKEIEALKISTESNKGSSYNKFREKIEELKNSAQVNKGPSQSKFREKIDALKNNTQANDSSQKKIQSNINEEKQVMKHQEEQENLMTEEEKEALHYQQVIQSYRHYGEYNLNKLLKKKLDFESITNLKQKQFIYNKYMSKLKQIETAIHSNSIFLTELIRDENPFIVGGESLLSNKEEAQVTYDNMDKVNVTLKMVIRDWSSLGETERNTAYKPLLNTLVNHFYNIKLEDRFNYRVLVPGAGLGRLTYDIARLGFSVQGNEFSYFMLLASAFMLNKLDKENMYKIYPYLNNFSNHLCIEDHLSYSFVPDIVPHYLPPNVDFSMVAGDFLEVYENDRNINSWDSIITCFFIDTAKNVLDYIELIYKILKPGAAWINIGPLLYHYENMSDEKSIELTYEELRLFIIQIGFVIQHEKREYTPYTSNLTSMLLHSYNCVMFKAIKPN